MDFSIFSSYLLFVQFNTTDTDIVLLYPDVGTS